MARSEPPQGSYFATDRLINDFGPPPPGPAATAWSQTTAEPTEPAPAGAEKAMLDLGVKVDAVAARLSALEGKIDLLTPPREGEEEAPAPEEPPTLEQKVDALIQLVEKFLEDRKQEDTQQEGTQQGIQVEIQPPDQGEEDKGDERR